MNRSHSTIYRICLLAVIVFTIAGGVFYYVNYVKNQTTVTEGTLVKGEAPEDMTVESFRPFGSTVKCA